MATVTERLALLISADVQGAVRGLNEVGKASKQHLGESEKRIDKVGRTFSKVGAGMLAVGGAAAVGLYKTVEAASDLEQAVGGSEAVFKEASGVITKYAKDAADSAGLSERAFREATTGIGGNLKRMGFSIDDAAKQSANLTQVAADLAATYGGTTAEAVSALGAAFRGEADPAERFNLNLKQGAVNAKAVELGLAATTSAVDEQAKAQALLALITEQSADAQGQFAREAGSAAGSAQIASAKFENAKASLGESLAPVMADAAGLAANLFDKFNQLNESTDGLASKLVIGATGFTLIGGAVTTAAGKVIQLNQSLRGVDGNLTRAGRGAAIFGKAVGALAIAGLAYETFRWADSLNDARVDLEKIKDVIGEDPESQLAEYIEFLGNQAEATFGDKGRRQAEGWFRTLAQESPAAAEAILAAGENSTKLGGALERVGVEFSTLQGILDEEVKSQVRSNEATERSAELIDKAAGATGEAAGATEDITQVTEEATDAFAEYSDGLEDAIDPVEALEDAIKDLNDAIKAQFDPLFDVNDALRENQDAQRRVEDAQRAAKTAQDDLNGAVYLYGKGSDEAKEAARRFEEAQRDVEDANRAAGRSAIDVTAAANNLAAQMRAGNIDFASAEQQIKQWGEQGLITKEQAKQMKDEMFLAALVADDLNSKDVVVEVSADTTRFWKTIGDLFSGAAGVPLGMGDVGGPLIVPQFNKAEGGFIPGPKGAPVFGIAHGGEYVASNEELDAMRRGGAAGLGQNGPTVVIETLIAGNQPTEQSIVRELRRQQHLLGVG